MTKDFLFKQIPEITQENGYSKISLAGSIPFISQGKPVIPHLRINVELPEDAEDVKITAIVSDEESIRLPAPPKFAPPPTTTGSSPSRSAGKPDSAIYSSDTLFPASTAELKGVFTKKGGKVAAVRVFPARVNPVSLEMLFAHSIRIEISYTEPSSSSRKRLALRAAPAASSRTYIVITTEAFSSEFTSLIAEKQAAGIPAEIISVENISTNYSGRDIQEKIRACITDNYENHGTKYVLLGGDNIAVPARMIHAEVPLEDSTKKADIPCDLYYACLDGSWDRDNDGVYGEITDGENGGEIDLLPEVYVGRVPASSADQIINFLAKNNAAPAHPYPDTALFMAEYLGQYDNTHSYGGNALDSIERLFPGFDINWLDDRPKKPSTPPSWSQSASYAALGASPNVVAHVGHGSATKTMGLSAVNLHSLTNEHPFLISSTACLVGSFDNASECFAKAMVTSVHGAYAAQMNTREGWFAVGYEYAFSGEFMDGFLFNVFLSRMPLGEAHFKSKEDLLPAVESDGDSASVYRWCYLENTLFGDPLATPNLPDPLAVTQLSFTNAVCISQEDTSSEFLFRITNTSPEPLAVSAVTASEFFSAAPINAVITPATETNLAFRAVMTPGLNLGPGIYTGTVCFSNLATSATKTCEIAVSLIPPPEITDSVNPADDLLIDFGEVYVGDTKNEFVTLANRSGAPFTVQSIISGNRLLANALRPADFIAYDRTSGRLCTFSTEAPEVAYKRISTAFEAICTAGDDEYAYVLTTGNVFGKLNLSTRHVSRISTASPEQITHSWGALAFNSRDGNFYAVSVKTKGTAANTSTFYLLSANGSQMIKLATVTGNFNSLAIDKTGLFYSIEVDAKKLCNVNPFTGEISVIGDVDDEINYSQALDFDSSGTILYWAATTESDCTVRILDTATARSTTILSLPVDDGQLYAPELEAAVLPAVSPFSATGIHTPAKLNGGSSSALEISFAPENPGVFTNRYSFMSPGASSPFATVTCTGTAIPIGEIPFWWLSKYNLPTDGSATYTDSDNDGVSNLDEFNAGTSPVDPASKLMLSCGFDTKTHRFAISWDAVPGFSYSVKRSFNLSPASFRTLANITATDTNVVCYVDTASTTNSFFKITR